MRKRTYVAVFAMAALGLSLASPKAASAFPAAPGADKTYTQTVRGNASVPVRFAVGRGGGWGGHGVGFGRGLGWGGGWGGGGWRGAGWRGGYGGWGGAGYGWGWPLGLGLGLAAATTYPYGGYYPGYGGYYGGGCSCGGW